MKKVCLSIFLLVFSSLANAKNIVVYLDGTTNSECDRLKSVDHYGVGRDTTNIMKMFNLTKTENQAVYYRRGVGSLNRNAFHLFPKNYASNATVGSLTAKVNGKECVLNSEVLQHDLEDFGEQWMSGIGVSANAKLAERYIREQYKEGDKVFIFGFSRGAASSHMLSNLLSKNLSYYKKFEEWLNNFFFNEESTSMHRSPIDVHFLGLFDTVYARLRDSAAVMVKGNSLALSINLPSSVKNAVHLLALDETRKNFMASRFKLNKINKDKIKSVWFAGSHLDIGGGRETRGIANITLNYMMSIAEKAGLNVKQMPERPHLDNVGKIRLESFDRTRDIINSRADVTFHPSTETIYLRNKNHTQCTAELKTMSKGCDGELGHLPQHLQTVLKSASSITCVDDSGYGTENSPKICQ